MKPALRVLLANPRGFCAGVERAIAAVEEVRAATDRPVYVRHEIVHNRRVVERLEREGVRFVEEVSEIPDGAVAVFSAHGVARAVEDEALRRGLPVVDATCPLVTRVHREAARHTGDGRTLIVIGHADHVEVQGILGRVSGPAVVVASAEEAERVAVPDPTRVAYVSQTTLSVDDARAVIAVLERRFPQIVGQDVRTICYATQNRQAAVRAIAERAERIVVCGARNSSNANRLREVAEARGRLAVLVERVEDLKPDFVAGIAVVGVAAGASTPECLVQETLARLASWRDISIEEVTAATETARFAAVDAHAALLAPDAKSAQVAG